ncbi:M15 family metallopeptidase [Olivibacter sp. SDN3]|uniref:M15 family metallopeptidase n=1 Tax=Olivibacter sp. SDN3 TaxID=2764720 RepID=UPI001C9E5DA3|nr:M15 family metallopeptidase [Olivibacter sp. SDN3]
MANLKALHVGSKGVEVRRWQYFLLGQQLYKGEVDGKFGLLTLEASKAFQQSQGLLPDGVVGNKTYGKAMLIGFEGATDTATDKQASNWPSKPDFKPLTNDAERAGIFGKFSYEHHPVPGDPEHIRILGNWQSENILAVEIPQLTAIAGIERINFHRLAVKQLQKLWSDWEALGLLSLVLTWQGSFNSRFVRGSRTSLSNHAFGTAFDINAAWNPLGAIPAFVGQEGSVRELVSIANNNGFYWGGHFTRKDGMHFEVAKLF